MFTIIKTNVDSFNTLVFPSPPGRNRNQPLHLAHNDTNTVQGARIHARTHIDNDNDDTTTTQTMNEVIRLDSDGCQENFHSFLQE